MKLLFPRIIWLVPALIATLALTLGTALAHEGREVEGYRFVVGWTDEPAYEGFKNGVEVRVTMEAHMPEDAPKAMPQGTDGGDYHSGSDDGGNGTSAYSMAMGQGMSMDHGEAIPVEGLEESLQVEVTHVPTGGSRVVSLYPTRNDPGHYTATLLPTAPGVYQFRVFGTIEGTPIDESFRSRGGGGGFDDINSSADLHFPDTLPEIRELESAIRGALNTAEQAQDLALAAASEDDGGSTSGVLVIVALVLGALGLATGAGSILFALRRR